QDTRLSLNDALPISRGAGPERVVEGEEQGLGALERGPAGVAAEAVTVAVDDRGRAITQHLDDRPAAALAEGLLEGAAEPRPAVRSEEHTSELQSPDQ